MIKTFNLKSKYCIKIKNVIKIGFFSVVLLFLSCNKEENIKSDLDKLESHYITDKRIEYWDVQFTDEEEGTKIHIETDKKAAYDSLLNFFSVKYPKLKVEVILLPETGHHRKVHALINNSAANLRTNARHSSELSTQVLLGTPVRVLKKERGWFLIQTPNEYIAWTDAANIELIDSTKLTEHKNKTKAIYIDQTGFSFTEPDLNSQVVSDLVAGCILVVNDSIGDFYYVEYPDGRQAYVSKNEMHHIHKFLAAKLSPEKLVSTANKFMGIPYLWGGTSAKAIDCSGFTSNVYFLNGVILQRDASQQTLYGTEITTKLSADLLKPGDLLFFGRKASNELPEKVTHVGLYIGNSEFIHASGSVHINSIDSTKNNYTDGYAKRFVRANRLIDNIGDKGIQPVFENEFYKQIITYKNGTE